MKRGDLIRYLNSQGCVLLREGSSKKICRQLEVPEIKK